MENRKEQVVQSEEDNKKKSKHTTLKIIGIIILLLLILLILFKCSYNPDTIKSSGIEKGVINLASKEDTQLLVNQAVEQGMFQVFMNTDIQVNSNKEANLLIQNSKQNHYSTYIVIYKDDEVIYKSDIIEPGYKLEKDRIEYELEPGVHECTAYFIVLDNNGKELNKIGLQVRMAKEK